MRNENASSGLLLMGHRWYDALLGRFLTRDPIGFRGGLNLYSYLAGNPINGVDPTGLRPRHPTPGERQSIVDYLKNELPAARKQRGEKPRTMDPTGMKPGSWACIDVYLNGLDQEGRGPNPGPLVNTINGLRDVKNVAESMVKAGTDKNGIPFFFKWNQQNLQYLRPGQVLILDSSSVPYQHSVVIRNVRKVNMAGFCSSGQSRIVIDVIGLSGHDFVEIDDYETYLGPGWTIRGFGDLPVP